MCFYPYCAQSEARHHGRMPGSLLMGYLRQRPRIGGSNFQAAVCRLQSVPKEYINPCQDKVVYNV